MEWRSQVMGDNLKEFGLTEIQRTLLFMQLFQLIIFCAQANPAHQTLCQLFNRGHVFRIERRSFIRSEEHTSELQSRENLVCRLLLEKKKPRVTHTARDDGPRGANGHVVVA